MPASSPPVVALSPHATTRAAAVHSLHVQLDTSDRDMLTLRYLLDGDLARIRVPAQARCPGRADGLWQHTCFEAFIRPWPASQQYYELNFSPAGDWAAYRFERYRAGMAPWDLPDAPRISVTRTAYRLELQAAVALPLERSAPPTPSRQLALAAVVEEEGGTLSYWSARHAVGKPDFHHPDAFVLEL